MTERSASTDRAPGGGPPPDGEKTRGVHKGLAMAVIAVAQLMVVLDVSIVNVALPSMQDALGFSLTNLEWVVNAYALAFGGLLLLGGRVADMFGQRKTLIIGLSVLTAASLLGGMATNQGWLIAARAVQGVSGALVAPAALALVASTFSEGAERNKAMGIYAAMGGAGGAIGNVLGGVFTESLSWRWVLFVNVPIGVVLIFAAVRAFPAGAAAVRGKLDLPGALTATAGISLVVYGLIHAATDHWGNAVTVSSLVAGGLLLVLFVLIEAKSRSPLMPLRLFGSPNRSGAYFIMLTLGLATIGLFYFLTLFMQIVFDFGAMKTGFAFLPFAVGGAIFATVSSQYVGKVGPRVLLTVGTLMAAGAMFWFSRLGVDGGYASDLLGPMILAGSSVGLCFVPLTLAAVSGVRKEEAGVPSALLNTGQQVGSALGLAVLGTLAATATKDKIRDAMGPAAADQADSYGSGDAAKMPPKVRGVVFDALTHGYSFAFLVAGFVMLGAVLVAFAVIRVPSSEAARMEGAVM